MENYTHMWWSGWKQNRNERILKIKHILTQPANSNGNNKSPKVKRTIDIEMIFSTIYVLLLLLHVSIPCKTCILLHANNDIVKVVRGALFNTRTSRRLPLISMRIINQFNMDV